jgi:hypothetical protein
MTTDVKETRGRIQSSIDDTILAFRLNRRSIMFSELAKSIPQHSWHSVFCALRRLAEDRQIELVPHQWDHEVIFESATGTEPPGPMGA